MKNKILLSILFLFFNIFCFSQNIDSIINSKPKTEEELINISRELLHKEILYNSIDIQKVIYIQKYINNKYHLGLSDEENLMLYYFTKNWENALTQIINFNHGLIDDEPPTAVVNLYKVLLIKILETNILEDLQKSNLSQEQKDFLILYFNCITLRITDISRNKFYKKLNKLIQLFKKDYPNSSYSQYLIC